MPTEFNGFAVFDLETTGIAVSKNHRVVEIGIVRLDETLDVVEEWETLINPGRDIGARDVHGITASDLREAPTFAELVADIWHRFEGAIPVAHNFAFDRRFMVSEFSRAGLDIGEFSGLCTMHLVGDSGVAMGARRLSDICWQLSIPVSDCHCAGSDARMCAEILKLLSKQYDIASLAKPASCMELWRRQATPLGITRQKARELPIESPLQLIADRLNSQHVDPGNSNVRVNDYLLVLDRILEDRVVDQAELEEILAFAAECGISSAQLDALHERYVANLASLVLSDGIVTDDERRDLDRVAGLLGVDPKVVELLLKNPAVPGEFLTENLGGKTVCFTGEFQCIVNGERMTRETAEATAASAGLKIAPRVTKKVDILVVADPDTASGKAKKAREYGIRIMAERPFWHKLGMVTE